MLRQRTNIFSAVVKQPVGGDMIAEQCRLMLEEQKIDLVPSYKIASKVSFLLILEQPHLASRHSTRPITNIATDLSISAIVSGGG